MAGARIKLAAAVAAALYLAAGAKGGHGIAASLVSIPAGGSYAPQAWARQFLAAIPEPRTSCNVSAVVAWANAEGGAWGGDGATDNPLNTTQPEPGDYSINSVGVKAYPSWQEGLQANVTAITNGLYGSVLSALSAGDDAQADADAVAASPWGTLPFHASC